jgi:hypothetical protein
MKKIVLIFGLISGFISSGLMLLTVPLVNNGTINNHNGEILGYTAIFLSFLLVFFGIRSYRENKGGGTITFGRAFSVGILITLISCFFYVVTWEIVYFQLKFAPDFLDKYNAREIATMREKGVPEATIAAKKKEMETMKDMYNNNLLFNAALTFIEPFPVGLIVTLVSAGILRKRTPAPLPGVVVAV